jgi:hypothetical protein
LYKSLPIGKIKIDDLTITSKFKLGALISNNSPPFVPHFEMLYATPQGGKENTS